MSARWMQRLGLFGMAAGPVLVSALSMGCAQERDPINRVQANAMSKHFFAGADLQATTDDPEFYMRNTVVDVPYGAAQDGLFTASYAQPLTRIKWEIQETNLIARETYERIANSDYNGSKSSNGGQVVAMFAISSHFDIRRDYNAQTGEETNVIVENATDRPWYQREYMRVDWSKNLVTDGYEVDTLSQIGIFGGVKFDPQAYYVEDPASADAPVFNPDQGYFDVTTKAYATPQTVDTPFGSFPACFLPQEYGGSNPIGNCNPTEVTLRLSFLQKQDSDYEPVDWNGNKQDAFGWFTVDRYGYDRHYGTLLDENWHRFAARYNIWQKSHIAGSQCGVDFWRDEAGNVLKYATDDTGAFVRDENGLPVPTTQDDPNGQAYPGIARSGGGVLSTDVHLDANKNGTEDACEFKGADGSLTNAGARCDEFTNKCALPLHQRTIKTIPWYYGKDAAPDLFPSTARALDQWNVAVKRAAVIGQMVEAQRVKADASSFMSATGASVTEQDLVDDAGATWADVFTLCHNPVIDTDNPACGAAGTVARLGDIRYNIVNIITNPQTPSPWGIMVDADDPLTGEKVATSVNEWGHVLDYASQATEDLLRWINGEITDQQIASGAYLRDWLKASKAGIAQNTPATLSKDEIKTRLGSIDLSMSKLVQLSPSQQAMPHTLRLKAASAALAQATGPSMNEQLEGARQSLIGTKWEAMMTSPEWLQGAGMDPSTPIAGNDAALAKASPLRGMNPMLAQWVRHMRDITMANHASCMVEQPEPDALVGLARQAARLYPLPNAKDKNYPALKAQRDEALHQWIREQFHVAVIAHEMGHSMGLRHNFTGTYDPLNFHTEYWQLRTQNGKEHYCVSPTQAGGFSPTAPLDAVTTHTDGHDCVGPRWVDPVTDEEVNGLIWKWGSSTVMDYPGDQTQDINNIGPYDKAAMRFGYSDVVDIDIKNNKLPAAGVDTGQGDKASAWVSALDGFGGITGRSVGSVHYSTYGDKYDVLGTCTAQTNAKDPLSAKCTGPELDFAAARDMHAVSQYGDAIAALSPQTIANFAVDKKGRARHPYMFGSDEFADFGNVPVFRFDSGADSYEQFQFLISTYENRYIFDNFRRDRVTFNSHTVIGRDMDRYFDKIQGMTKSLALLIGLEGQNASSAITNPGNLMPLALGAADSLKMFMRIMTRPEPGRYSLATPATSPNPGAMELSPSVVGTTGITGYAKAEDSFNTTPGTFNVMLGSGEGRYLHNDYDYTQGYYWSDYQTQVGSFFEKQEAVFYLTEAYNHFISNSKDDYIDGRYKNLNYASIYPNQIRRFFSQVLQNDPYAFGPYITLQTGGTSLATDSTARVQYLPFDLYDFAKDATISLDYPPNAVVLDPLLGWEQQYRTLIYLFHFGPTTLTMDFVDQLRIYSPGGVDSISIDPLQQVRYRDPATGIEYVARGYGTETVNSRLPKVSKSMGARMIQYANQLAAATYVAKSVDPITGEITYDMDAATGMPKCLWTGTATEYLCTQNTTTLKAYSANLDIVRQLTAHFGYGPLGHGE